MPDLTDKEYDALDEYWTTHTPKLSGNRKGGFFAKKAEESGCFNLVAVDDLTATWLQVKANADHTTPDEVINNLVRREIIAAATA